MRKKLKDFVESAIFEKYQMIVIKYNVVYFLNQRWKEREVLKNSNLEFIKEKRLFVFIVTVIFTIIRKRVDFVYYIFVYR